MFPCRSFRFYPRDLLNIHLPISGQGEGVRTTRSSVSVGSGVSPSRLLQVASFFGDVLEMCGGGVVSRVNSCYHHVLDIWHSIIMYYIWKVISNGLFLFGFKETYGCFQNRDTPKWIFYNGTPYQNGWFGGTPIFGNIHICSTCITSIWFRCHPACFGCHVAGGWRNSCFTLFSSWKGWVDQSPQRKHGCLPVLHSNATLTSCRCISSWKTCCSICVVLHVS